MKQNFNLKRLRRRSVAGASSKPGTIRFTRSVVRWLENDLLDAINADGRAVIKAECGFGVGGD
ncbi:MAG TPA: hypothetical protein VIE47_08205, partial [Methylocystis sp.]